MTTSSRRYVQHIADLSSDYRPQREWGEGRGILMVVGHFLVGIAGGAWVMGALYGSIAAQAVAVGLGVLGAFAHLAFLGKPARAFGMMRRVRTSWIARGFVGLSLFLIGGSAYLASWWLGSDAGALRWLSRIANPIAWVGALTIIGYMGFCYTASKAVPFWHSPLHPAIYIAYAARGGIAALLLVAAVSGAQPEPQLLYLWVGVTAIVVLFFVLEIQGGARWRERRGAMVRARHARRAACADLLRGNPDHRARRPDVARRRRQPLHADRPRGHRPGFDDRRLLHEVVDGSCWRLPAAGDAGAAPARLSGADRRAAFGLDGHARGQACGETG